jgi:hypothetical protein
MNRLLSVAIGLVVLSTVSTAFAQRIASLQVVSVMGTGCPNPTDYSVAVAPDGMSFAVQYVGYKATPGQKAPKNCNFIVRLNVPDGYAYALSEVKLGGATHLEANANATAKAWFWFQGSPRQGFLTHDIRSSTLSAPGTHVDGVIDDLWETNDEIGLASMIWSQCGMQRDIVLNTELTATAPAGDSLSYVQMDNSGARYTIAFRPCP